MSTAEPLTGRVARVLNSRALVINRGSEHGVERGMIFEVLDTGGSDIKDPETGEVIGSVYRAKVRVRVVIVEPRLAVARTYRTQQKNVGGSGGFVDVGAMLRPPRWIEIPETFRSEEAAWEDLPEEQSFVKTGDPVRQVITRSRRTSGEADDGEDAEAVEPPIPQPEATPSEPAE